MYKFLIKKEFAELRLGIDKSAIKNQVEEFVRLVQGDKYVEMFREEEFVERDQTEDKFVEIVQEEEFVTQNQAEEHVELSQAEEFVDKFPTLKEFVDMKQDIDKKEELTQLLMHELMQDWHSTFLKLLLIS